MDLLFWLAVATVVVVLCFDYTNGFHDAANIVATVIASRAMTPAQAVIIVGIFEFLGPLLGGTAVANTIGSFVRLDGIDPASALTILLCGLLGAIVWNLLTWWRGIPSSSSHALVGGLVGVVVVSAGADQVVFSNERSASYGSLSNQVVDLTVVATDLANPGARYTARTLTRDEPATKAVLTHVGRALVTEATLQVVPNYNLRCLSITDLPSATIFAAPTAADPVPANSFASFLDSMGRVEIIWYPFSDNPWLHTWQVAPTKPSSSIAVSTPFNYPFADYVPEGLQNLITHLVKGDPSLTPAVGQMAARVTAFGLDGENWAGVSGTYPVSRDIWGSSKNSLLYIQATTLRVTANGYAIHLRRSDVQQAVHDLIGQYTSMLTGYAAKGSYPVNSALELRVTALDDPGRVGVQGAESPVISALSQSPVDVTNGWDVAVWFDVLTIPGTAGADQF